MRKEIDLMLSDSTVLENLRRILESEEDPLEIELEHRRIFVPRGVSLEIVRKSAYTNNFQVGFGNHSRAWVAVGGVVSVSCGVIEPGLCFATLYFNEQGELMTVDFWD